MLGIPLYVLCTISLIEVKLTKTMELTSIKEVMV